MQKQVKIGLALGSGSSRGWAHIGVIQALNELGIEPDIVCGSSIGALVGAAYVNHNLETLKTWVCSLNANKTAKFLKINASFNGLVNQERFHMFLNDTIAANYVLIEDLEKTFAAVSTDLETGQEICIQKGPLIDAVWASTALPGLFPVIHQHGHWLVDGGLSNPVPTSVCRALGADIVIAVNLNGGIVGKHFNNKSTAQKNQNGQNAPQKNGDMIAGFVKQYTSNWFDKEENQTPRIFEAIAGSINIMQDKITHCRLASDPADLMIEPQLSHIRLMEFYRASESIKEGFEAVFRKKSELESLCV